MNDQDRRKQQLELWNERKTRRKGRDRKKRQQHGKKRKNDDRNRRRRTRKNSRYRIYWIRWEWDELQNNMDYKLIMS